MSEKRFAAVERCLTILESTHGCAERTGDDAWAELAAAREDLLAVAPANVAQQAQPAIALLERVLASGFMPDKNETRCDIVKFLAAQRQA
jgi:hypothetical protein